MRVPATVIHVEVFSWFHQRRSVLPDMLVVMTMKMGVVHQVLAKEMVTSSVCERDRDKNDKLQVL